MESLRRTAPPGVLLVVVALAFAACAGASGATGSPVTAGSTSGPTALSTPPAGGVPTVLPTNPKLIATLTFQVELTGGAAASGSISRKLDLDFKASRPCSDVVLDDIFFDGPIGAHTVALVLVATDPTLKTGTIGLDVASSLTMDQAEETTFAPATADTTRIFVNADGAGQLNLANWGSSTGAMESGTITWTCSS